jgi:hypothetical protein
MLDLNFPLQAFKFSKFPREVISMISSILGYDNDLLVDEVILGIMDGISSSF